MKRKLLLLLLATPLLLCLRGENDQTDSTQTAAEIRRRLTLDSSQLEGTASGSEAHETELARFYRLRGYAPAWSRGNGRPRLLVGELIGFLGRIGDYGLNRRDYDVEGLEALRKAAIAAHSLGPRERAVAAAELDLAASRSFLLCARHLHGGRFDPRQLGLPWYATRQNPNVTAALESAAKIGHIEPALTPLMPENPAYSALRAQFADWRGGIPGGAPAVATGEKAELGPAQRARTLELNLERWRWLPNLGERYLVVNIPDFTLDLVEHGQAVMRMRVVVGKPYQQTPVLSDEMTHIVLNPYWNVPESIARDEILPHLKDPGYLSREDMEVVRGDGDDAAPVDPQTVDWKAASAQNLRIRQRPGGKNALGHIKFMFPNHLNIYLHDTPAGNLFAKTERDFSHGCIRVERPLDLAAHLLRETGWTREKIRSTIASGRTMSVPLPQPLPIHILYWTAWVDDRGDVQFRSDVYGQDSVLAQALTQRDAAPASMRLTSAGPGR